MVPPLVHLLNYPLYWKLYSLQHPSIQAEHMLKLYILVRLFKRVFARKNKLNIEGWSKYEIEIINWHWKVEERLGRMHLWEAGGSTCSRNICISLPHWSVEGTVWERGGEGQGWRGSCILWWWTLFSQKVVRLKDVFIHHSHWYARGGGGHVDIFMFVILLRPFNRPGVAGLFYKHLRHWLIK